MRVIVGSDHAGLDLRLQLTEVLVRLGHEVDAVGAVDEHPYDYPDAAVSVACALIEGRAERGVLVCGTGIGVSIQANRFPQIRAAVCSDPAAARLAREHNHANVLCLGARLTGAREAIAILGAFFETSEDCHDRHLRRVRKLGESAVCD